MAYEVETSYMYDILAEPLIRIDYSAVLGWKC